MASDHRGRELHAGKRTSDEAKARLAAIRESRENSRNVLLPFRNLKDHKIEKDPYEQPDEGYRPDNVMWDKGY